MTNCDSSAASATVGTADLYAHVMLQYSDAELLGVLDVGGSSADIVRSTSSSSAHTALYKEIQVHGLVRMADDIEALVLNGVHVGNADVARLAERFAAKYRVNVIQLDR